MNTNHSNFDTTCILLFSQSEEQESKSKSIANNNRQNVLLWKKMNERVIRVIQKTKLQYFHSNETNQVGNCFGEKLANAIESVFEKGFHKVIILGNDCPQLSTKIIMQAATKIQHNDFVFGPDANGGLYLIALSKQHFAKEQFASLEWNTKILFNTIINTFSSHSIKLLNKLNDFNDRETLKKIIFTFSYNSLFRSIILALVIQFIFLCTTNLYFIKIQYSSILYNKGSPVFCFNFLQ